MSNSTVIKTTKIIYPQIYAYVTPDYAANEGWIKIGYTEQRNVDDRIREQTQTAGIQYDKLWFGPAKFHNSDAWFKDKELHSYLRKFKDVEQRPKSEWFYYDGYPEKAHEHYEEFCCKDWAQTSKSQDYTLRAEQEEAVQKTLAYIVSKCQRREFLWNAKPRFGKTLTAYDLTCRMKANNVLIVTNRPAIANSWFDDFEKFIAHKSHYLFVSTTDSLKERPVLTREQFVENPYKPDGQQAGYMAFISLQDLKGAISFGGPYDKLAWVKELKWDLLIIDEAHEGIDTLKTDVAFNNITRDFTLHLSGTPFKQVASGKFHEEQIFNWTYADEQQAKADWDTTSEENNPYEGLPRLNMFSYQMSQMITGEVNKGAEIDGKNIDFAFDLNEFFETNNSGKFVHEAEVKKWLDTLTRNEKYPFSTPELRAELKHTFWLLNRIASAKALEKLLKAHPDFEKYEIILAAGDGKSEEDDPTVTEKSFDRVRKAIFEHEYTITLSVGQLTTGVTVPEWTGVMILSNVQSPSLYMQAAFRAQNPWSYTVAGEKQRKENAYVFDFAPERTLTIYDEFANNLSRKTVGGGGTTGDREENIRVLLNFFPVIAEDSEGRMVALDVNQVLTIPKAIKAAEVVKRGFMSNLLFQNIDRIFAAEAKEVREILEQLNPVAPGRVTPSATASRIDTQGVEVDGKGQAVVSNDIVIATTDARFGEPIYTTLAGVASQPAPNMATAIATTFTKNVLDTAKEIAREHKVTAAQADAIVRQSANVLAREVEVVQKQAEIDAATAKVEFERVAKAPESNPAAVAEAKVRFEARQQEIAEQLQEGLAETVATKTKELIESTTGEILQRGEERKKVTVEDDIRSRLRGFARTIPSFLMAYGELDTTLENFDDNIKDEVFHEVTGITLDQFRVLRDQYNFFDAVVFNESVQEFLRKKEELANYFDENQIEDIFDYIPPQQTNQIFTPKRVVKMMIDSLEEENPGLFSDKSKTFADLYVKSGLYLTEIVKRLYKGLESEIPDEKLRLRYILEDQIYGFAPTEIIYAIAKNFIFGNFADIDSSNFRCHDLTDAAKGEEEFNMKFDVVVGNPPYQEETKGTSDTPVYPYFYDLAEQIAPKYCLISPARFLFNAGKTPVAWNRKMLDDEHLKVLFHEQVSQKIFAGPDIPGGIAIVYRDKEFKFGKIGTFTIFNELNSIVKKVSSTPDFESIEPIIYLQQRLNLNTLYADFPDAREVVGSQGKEKRLTTSIFTTLEIFNDTPPKQKHVRILGLIGNQRIYKYVHQKYLEKHLNLEKHKVIVPAANGSGAIGEVASTPLIGEPVIGEPFVGHTQSFISFGAFDNEVKAQNCLKYIRSKFARTMLGVLKVTQHNTSEKWVHVPLQDFTPESDIDWTKSIPEIDQQLYTKYGLSKKEIDFIEEKVKAMK